MLLNQLFEASATPSCIHAEGYEVDLTVDPPRVQKVKHRKPLGYGYSYAPGADTYRMTIKVGSQNWKRAVRAAKSQLDEKVSFGKRLFGTSRRAAQQQLVALGWEPTTIPGEWRHPDAPDYSVDLDVNDVNGRPFTVFYRARKIGQQDHPPYASHLRLRPSLSAQQVTQAL